MCDHQEKVSGLHDLREREPEMCNLLMTWFHMQNPLSADFLHKICAQHKIQIQRMKYTTHNLIWTQFSCSYQLRTEPKYKKNVFAWFQLQTPPSSPPYCTKFAAVKISDKMLKDSINLPRRQNRGWNIFYKLFLIHWSPNFLAQGPRRSQLRRQIFISGFHGLISSDKVGVRIRKLGGDWEELWLLSQNCIDLQRVVFISGLFVLFVQ